MATFLVHITCGPDNPTKAALGLLVARTAAAEGHSVSLFLAGDGVHLLRSEVLDSLVGQGTGAAGEHVDALRQSGAQFYASGMSAKARGIGEEDTGRTGAGFAMPDVLVRLALDSDRVLVY